MSICEGAPYSTEIARVLESVVNNISLSFQAYKVISESPNGALQPRECLGARLNKSGLVMVEGAMIALIDIANLLSDVTDMTDGRSAMH